MAFRNFDEVAEAVSKGMTPLLENQNCQAADYNDGPKVASAAACALACANDARCRAMTRREGKPAL